MIASTFEHIKITGVASAVPTRKFHNEDYAELFGKETVNKLIASTGVWESYHVHEKQTASGLAFAAAEHQFQERGIDPHIGLKSDGSRFKAITVPAGGFCNPNASREMDVWVDGNRRSDYNHYMNSTDIPVLFEKFMEHYHVAADKVDKLVMHQPNAFNLKRLAKKIKISMGKVPLSLNRYGNTSGMSIPEIPRNEAGNVLYSDLERLYG